MKNNEEIIKNYEEFRRVIENASDKTWTSEFYTFKKLDEYVKEKPFKKLTELEIAKYLERYSRKTRITRITILTKFYRWLYKLDHDEKLPDCIRNINKNRKTIMEIYDDDDIKYRERVVTEEEYQRLIDCAYKLMHKAMIETLYNFGCRASELLSMNGNDVVYNGNVTKIKVRESKTKAREIIFSGRSEYLMKWFESYAPFKNKRDKPLWTNYQQRYKNERFTINGLGKSIRVISERAGLRKITPHDFRHTAITRARNEGVPDTHIETNFGLKKDTRMMKIYDHNGIKDYEDYLKDRQEEIKPTYEQLEKKYKDKDEKQQNEIDDLKDKLNKTIFLLEHIVKEETKTVREEIEDDIKSDRELAKMTKEERDSLKTITKKEYYEGLLNSIKK